MVFHWISIQREAPMPIDPLQEQLLSFNDAAALLPVTARPSAATWWRWWRRGVHGVKLETLAIGGRRLTSREAVARFITATTLATEPALPQNRDAIGAPSSRSQVAAQLKKAGIAVDRRASSSDERPDLGVSP